MKNNSSTYEIIPGSYVINEFKKDWGIGQVQSSINYKITINFEHVGKKVIDINEIPIKVIKLK